MFFIAIFLSFLCAVLLAPLFIYTKGKLELRDNKLFVKVTFIGIPIIKRHYTFEREKSKLISIYTHKKNKKEYVTSLYDIISNKSRDSVKLARSKTYRYLYRHAHINLKASFSLGTGDAAITSNICGSFKIASAIAAGKYSGKKRIYEISIIPVFSGAQLTADINCIIKLSLANIIIGYLIYKKTIRR